MLQFLSDPNFGWLDHEFHHLALAIAKKTLNENWLKHAQKMTNHTPPNFKVCNRVFFETKQPGKLDLKRRAGYRIVHIELKGH